MFLTTEDGTPIDLSSLGSYSAEAGLGANPGVINEKRVTTQKTVGPKGRDLPATQTQVGSLNGELARLGFRTSDDDETSFIYSLMSDEEKTQRHATSHAGRLELCSKLAGREITSTKELTRGEAGKLIKALGQCEKYDDIPTILPTDEASEPDSATLLSDALDEFFADLARARVKLMDTLSAHGLALPM